MCVSHADHCTVMQVSNMRPIQENSQTTYQVDVFHHQYTSTHPLGRSIPQSFSSGLDLKGKTTDISARSLHASFGSPTIRIPQFEVFISWTRNFDWTTSMPEVYYEVVPCKSLPL